MTVERKEPSRPASFRLVNRAHEMLYSRAKEAGVSTREWLERAILENRTRIIAKQKPHPELRPLLFQVNKAGNNLNQIAHRLNTAVLAGTLSQGDFKVALASLSEIQDALHEALNHASKS